MLDSPDSPSHSAERSVSPRLLVSLIIAGVAVWGLYHVVGASRWGIGRGIVVAVSFALFLGLWGVLLAWRKKNSRSRHL